ncbi:early nodulin-like protein 12 [Raphanus sativus]|uniref:Early nodulin-like protein 13 n=1 Tax=Raphanus sativus TaxID=3726 RepID=A0A6J0LS37_RAPSA|nr:early nodulin-like protein 13 [Raphanus sativus]KAJ4880553.1 early nodulin-like protein 12 [Raphanus sativus]
MGVIVPVLTLVFLLLTTVSHAASKPRMILVGGSSQSWKVPDSSSNTLNQWAENNRFKVGDILVWKYDAKVDSVLQVTKEDYDSCNTSNPLKQYNDGDTKFELENSGAYFFISGAPDHCAKGQKMHLVVLAERNVPGGGSSGDRDEGGNPKVTPVIPLAKTPAPAPAHNAAGGLNVGSGLFLTAVAIGLAMA